VRLLLRDCIGLPREHLYDDVYTFYDCVCGCHHKMDGKARMLVARPRLPVICTSVAAVGSVGPCEERGEEKRGEKISPPKETVSK
jgi:hypothetical protein